jgi:integrase
MTTLVGLRQGEALGLRWQDVDLEGGTVRVGNQLQRVNGQLRLVPVKTARSRRSLLLPVSTLGVLRHIYRSTPHSGLPRPNRHLGLRTPWMLMTRLA